MSINMQMSRRKTSRNINKILFFTIICLLRNNWNKNYREKMVNIPEEAKFLDFGFHVWV